MLSRYVYNERHRARDAALNGRLPIEALLGDLAENGILYDFQLDAEGRVTHHFFTLSQGIELANKYHQVVLMDSTYKRN